MFTTNIPDISKLGDTLKIQGVATESASLSLMLNDTEVAIAEGTELSYDCVLTDVGDFRFTFSATKNGEVKQLLHKPA